jgi:hypothetical protein
MSDDDFHTDKCPEHQGCLLRLQKQETETSLLRQLAEKNCHAVERLSAFVDEIGIQKAKNMNEIMHIQKDFEAQKLATDVALANLKQIGDKSLEDLKESFLEQINTIKKLIVLTIGSIVSLAIAVLISGKYH